MRPIWEIAQEIYFEWGNSSVDRNARPYLEAMMDLDKITDKYYADDARTVVLYFLSNAGGWRGEAARRIKAELKAMLK
jgi:uncharacterized protein (DUF2267 family)